MTRIKKVIAASAAVFLLLTACGKNNDEPAETTKAPAAKPDFSSAAPEEAVPEETVSIYTGKAVENEEDLAIFKFNCTPPEGYETAIDSAEGKMYVSPNGGIIQRGWFSTLFFIRENKGDAKSISFACILGRNRKNQFARPDCSIP